MRHLTRDQMLWLAEEAGSDHPHLLECGRCRHEVTGIRAVVRDLERVQVPEPSPLFWGHLSERIGAALHVEPPPAPTRRESWGRWIAWAAPLTAVVVLAVTLVRLPSTVVAPGESNTQMGRIPAVEGADWQLVRDAISEDESGVAETLTQVDPGSAEDLVDGLSVDERAALVALLRSELSLPR